jgi:2-dehydro-3-deoxygalactonokinase
LGLTVQAADATHNLKGSRKAAMPDELRGNECIAVDWGNSNRRAYRVSINGEILDSFTDSKGVLTLDPTCFDAAVKEIRQRLGDLPMLLAGPIGSNRGWRNVPYVPCPATAFDLADKLHWVDRRTAIVPGLCRSDPYDVLRGEEVQALGAIAIGGAAANGVICLPGTHSKWIRTQSGGLASFTSAITGELFGLLRQHSILADVLAGQVIDGPAFRGGVLDAIEGKPLMQALFGIRAAHVLGHGDGEGASYASGLLIGTDWRDNAPADISAVTLVGEPALCALYASAASIAGQKTNAVDGGKAFVAGMMTLQAHLP